MTFLIVYSWDKDRRDEVIKRRLEKGRMYPSGVKVLGEWTAVGRSKGFLIIEADDPKLISQANIAWNDILDTDLHLVLDTEKDLLGLLKGVA